MSKRKQSEDSRSKGDKKHKATNGIAPGMVGFLIMADRGTTQKALNEAISFFEEYIARVYPEVTKPDDISNEFVGVEDELAAELAGMRSRARAKTSLFKKVDSGVECIGFLHVTNLQRLPTCNTAEFLLRFLEDFASHRIICRYINRILPFEAICYSVPEDVQSCISKILATRLPAMAERHKDTPESIVTYSVNFKRRYDNGRVDRESTTSAIASQIINLDPTLVVDLKRPDITVIVEVISSICGLALVDKYYSFARYNLKLMAKEIH